jgi:hypothetical protein
MSTKKETWPLGTEVSRMSFSCLEQQWIPATVRVWINTSSSEFSASLKDGVTCHELRGPYSMSDAYSWRGERNVMSCVL